MKPPPPLGQPVVKNVLILLLLVLLAMTFGHTQAEDSLTAFELRVLGKKYTQEPLESRITRLEGALKQPAVKNVSLEYRLARLYSLQELAISREAQNAAIRSYNRGVDAAAQRNYEKAIQAYQEAIRLNPGMIEAYNNLGNMLEQISKYNEAIQTYQKALEQAPNHPLLYRNLGVVYEKSGNVEQALTYYRQYLKLSTSPDPSIANLVANMDAQRLTGQGSPDYVAVTQTGSQGEKLVWPREINPIPIYIELAPDQTAFLPAIHDGMKAWELASLKRIRFKEVTSPVEASIRVTLQEGPLAHPNLEVGHARYDVLSDPARNRRDWKVYIVVNTGERTAPISLEDRLIHVKRLALHEIGHAIGIWGHSSDPGDIMYSHPIASQLSNRDIQTIRKLYGVKSSS